MINKCRFYKKSSFAACKSAYKHRNLLIIIYSSIPVRSTKTPLGRNSKRGFCIVSIFRSVSCYTLAVNFHQNVQGVSVFCVFQRFPLHLGRFLGEKWARSNEQIPIFAISYLPYGQTYPSPTPALHVTHTRKGYQTGDSGEEGPACTWVQIPAAGEETAGKAGSDVAQIRGRGDGERLFLAWA